MNSLLWQKKHFHFAFPTVSSCWFFLVPHEFALSLFFAVYNANALFFCRQFRPYAIFSQSIGPYLFRASLCPLGLYLIPSLFLASPIPTMTFKVLFFCQCDLALCGSLLSGAFSP